MNPLQSISGKRTIYPFAIALGLLAGALASPQPTRANRLQGSPYFPDRGWAALYQRSLDLQNVATVVSVAMEPGQEDLATMAYLRLGRGARVINLYVTNGEATPSDSTEEPPLRLAARRKEEATRALLYLGVEPYFLNLPDFGVPSGRRELDSVWKADSLIHRLATFILTYRPDVIFLARDFRFVSASGTTTEGFESLRQEAVKEMLLKAAGAASGAVELPGVTPANARLRWKVQRIFVDRGSPSQPVRVNTNLQHPISKKSYEKIAEEARQYYRSLRAQVRYWQGRGRRSYTYLYPPSKKPPLSLDRGLVLSGPNLRPLADTVNRIAMQARAGKGAQLLPVLASTIDSIDQRIGFENLQGSLTNQKALVTWKNRLERLRCLVLDVDIDFELSDSLISRSQLFFLRFKKFKAKITKGRTFILFPGAMELKWVINEALEHQLPFEVPKEFRILSPKDLDYDSPTALHGLERPTLGTTFSFIIFHKDSLRERNFQYRKDIVLGVGPRFAAEVLTPLVLAVPREELIYRFQNFTRDGVYGDAFVNDSVCQSERKRFHLKTKDSWVIDTLRLSWSDTLAPGDHVLELKISDEPVARFVARNFAVNVDTTRKVGLITGLGTSSLKEALRRLKIAPVPLDSFSLNSSTLLSIQTILVDRSAASLRPDLLGSLPSLLNWTKAGGHLVFLSSASHDTAARSLGFRTWPALAPTTKVLADTAHSFLSHPNKIQDLDWEGWISARAWGSVDPAVAEGGEIVVRSQDTGVALLVTKKEGDGRITYIALELSSQLLNIHPGAYRLLANLVSSRYIPR